MTDSYPMGGIRKPHNKKLNIRGRQFWTEHPPFHIAQINKIHLAAINNPIPRNISFRVQPLPLERTQVNSPVASAKQARFTERVEKAPML